MSESKLATFKLDGDRWQAFQEKAAQSDRTASELLRQFVDGVIDGSIDTAIAPARWGLEQLESISSMEKRIDLIGDVEQRIEARLQQFEGELLGKFGA